MYVALTRAQGRLYLPCAVEETDGRDGKRAAGDAKRLRGSYDHINRRLARLLRECDPSLSVEDVVVEKPGASIAVPRAPGVAASLWTPPLALLQAESDDGAYSELREAHAGPFVTSYTRMKEGRGSGRIASVDYLDERRREKANDTVDQTSATALRAARTSGIFLHELLERVPIASFPSAATSLSMPSPPPGTAASAPFELWRARPDVSSLVAEALAVHRIERAQRDHAEQMVWTAYTTALDLPDGGRIGGLAHAARVVREMDFVFPIPERDHPTLAEPPSGPLTIGRGYVRGSLDLAFEQAGVRISSTGRVIRWTPSSRKM